MSEKIVADDEIDLRELAKTIWKNRVFVVVFTLVVTLAGGGLCDTKKPHANL